MFARLRSWWTKYQREALRSKVWGRQPASGMSVMMKARAQMRIRVQRAGSGEWEDHGVVMDKTVEIDRDDYARLINEAINGRAIHSRQE